MIIINEDSQEVEDEIHQYKYFYVRWKHELT